MDGQDRWMARTFQLSLDGWPRSLDGQDLLAIAGSAHSRLAEASRDPPYVIMGYISKFTSVQRFDSAEKLLNFIGKVGVLK